LKTRKRNSEYKRDRLPSAPIDTSSPKHVTFALWPKQLAAMEALKMPRTDRDWQAVAKETEPIFVLMGGSKGPGKDYLGCSWSYTYALSVIARFGLWSAKEVPHIGWMGRKRATDFVATTLQTWQEIIPADCYELKAATPKHPQHILIDDRVAIDYGGLDARSDIERFNSAEYAFIYLNQAEETSQDDVSVLFGSLRKQLRDPTKRIQTMCPLPYRVLLSANPKQCWVKDRFVDHPDANHVFISATYRDNYSLPPSYCKTLEDAFSHRPDLLKAYRDGDWSALSGTNQVILQEWISAAKMRKQAPPYRKRWVSVDPARFGDDSGVILGGENTRIIDARVLPYCTEPQLVTAAEAMSVRLGNVPIIVEVVGVCGVGDYLTEDGFEVIEYCPMGKMEDAEAGMRYANPRSRMWSTVGRWMQTGMFDETMGGMFELPEPKDAGTRAAWAKVCEQLCWPAYDYRGQKIYIETKEDIKQEHSGVSPDYADCYVNGVGHLDVIPAIDDLGGETAVEEHRRLIAKYRRPA
jgi:hypothetical protein